MRKELHRSRRLHPDVARNAAQRRCIRDWRLDPGDWRWIIRRACRGNDRAVASGASYSFASNSSKLTRNAFAAVTSIASVGFAVLPLDASGDSVRSELPSERGRANGADRIGHAPFNPPKTRLHNKRRSTAPFRGEWGVLSTTWPPHPHLSTTGRRH